MKKLLLCFLLLLANVCVWAQTRTDNSGTWRYTVSSNGEATITGTMLTSGTDLNIPDQIDGYPVTAIGNRAFWDRSGFTGSLTIPSGVTTIGDSAFWNCRGLTGELTIPSSVTTIGRGAFKGCYGFTGSLTIPSSVTTIGNEALREFGIRK